ncbi:nucleocapsid protein [Ambe virus]|uniref:Nucleoprotein n=1 Tax=Ambe virus TaxID=1926500 RepID=A0A1S5SHU8_9VIRU|nr:nucleocapsid protein [Ambe virus]API68875.1 nucleocapsid protein [Ambe virus]
MTDYQALAIEFANAGVSPAEIQDWVREFAYQGFDAHRIIELLRTLGGDAWQADARRMIVLGLTRGNKLEKMVMRMSDKGKQATADLVRKYKLKSGNPSRDELTLSRVAAALAGWTCQALVAVQEHLPITGSYMDSVSPGYPRQMMHPSFAGLVDPTIPQTHLDTVLEAHSLYLVHFSRMINPELRGRPRSEVVATFRQPMLAAVNSNFITPEQRRKFLVSFGIVNSNGVPSAQVTAAANVFKAMP